jgi:hypothetical protein
MMNSPPGEIWSHSGASFFFRVNVCNLMMEATLPPAGEDVI